MDRPCGGEPGPGHRGSPARTSRVFGRRESSWAHNQRRLAGEIGPPKSAANGVIWFTGGSRSGRSAGQKDACRAATGGGTRKEAGLFQLGVGQSSKKKEVGKQGVTRLGKKRGLPNGGCPAWGQPQDRDRAADRSGGSGRGIGKGSGRMNKSRLHHQERDRTSNSHRKRTKLGAAPECHRALAVSRWSSCLGGRRHNKKKTGTL